MTNENGHSPLELAMRHNAGAAVGMLIFYGANDPEDNAKRLLRSSIRLGSFAAIQAASDMNAIDSDCGRTSLHWAIWRGSLPALKLLQTRNAQDNTRDNTGSTALHIASAAGHDTIVRLHIDGFASNRNAATDDGSTPLHLACTGGHDSTIRLLIENFDANTKAKNTIGQTALYLLLKKMYLSQILDPHTTRHSQRTDDGLVR